MHELAVTQSILDIAIHHAEQAKARSITDLYLVIGEFSSIVDDSIQFYWDIYAKGTMAEGARLHFRRIPAELECMLCGTRYPPKQDDLNCPACGEHGRVVAGNEFYMDSIEVDTDEQGEPS